MRGYFKFRIILLTVLMGVAVFLANDGFAQATSAPADSSASLNAAKEGIGQLILSNRDPVFYTIALLSFVGLALIIQGFIKTREAVLMPPTTTNQIREMINAR